MTRSRLPQAGTRHAVTVSEAATMLRVTPASVRNYLARGQLSGYSIESGQRRRRFVWVDSILRLQEGVHGSDESGESADENADVGAERDYWRARAAQLGAEVAYLRGALEDALAAHDLQARSADKLRDVATKQHHALAQYTTLEDELVR